MFNVITTCQSNTSKLVCGIRVSQKIAFNQWRIFWVFKVFSEHLELKKKILKIRYTVYVSD